MNPMLILSSEFLVRHDVAGPLVVGVSGGADSVALVRVLVALRPAEVVVCHVDHQLRGDASRRDRDFVEALASQLGVPVHLKSIDPAAAGGNREATARRLRYAALAEVAQAVGAGWVAVGHHADDQAETVLHHILRGTGLAGLRGIAADSELAPGVRLIRPLLGVTRREIDAYLVPLNQPHVEDATNADVGFTRNRLRHDLLPLLLREAPTLPANLARLAEQSAEAEALLRDYAALTLVKHELPRAGCIVVLAGGLAEEAPPLVRRVLRRIWEREAWPRGDMTAEHWHRAAAVILGEVPAVDGPGGISVRRVRRVVQIGPQS